MSNQEQEYPRRLFGVSSVFEYQRDMVSSEISSVNVYRNAHSFLKAPFYSVNQSAPSTTRLDADFWGEIGLGALRDNENRVLWDVEAGDVLNIEILSQNFIDDRVYNGKVEVVDESSRSDLTWEMLENRVEIDENGFDYGAIALKQIPRIFDEGEYDFFIESVERKNQYLGPVEKLRSVFDYHTPDVESAIEILEQDPDKLSYGRV